MVAKHSNSSSFGVGGRDVALWLAAATLVVSAHAAIAFAAFNTAAEPPIPEPAESAMMVELAPLAAAPEPDSTESEASEAVQDVAEPVEEEVPEQEVPEPVVEEVVEQEVTEPVEPITEDVEAPVEEAETETVEDEEVIEPVAEEPDVVLPKVAMIPTPRPNPVETPPLKKPEKAKKPAAKAAKSPPPSVASKKTQKAETAAPRAAAPAANAGSGRTVSPAKWQARVSAHLNRRKRFPSGTRAKGVATVTFTINASGAVTHTSLVRSSGDATLDKAAVALVQRASPVPAPPPGISKSSLSLTVPIEYSRR